MLKGLITALVTPMKEDFALDLDALQKLVAFQIEQGVDGILVAGSTGESPTLTENEKTLLIKTALTEAKNVVHVIAGIDASATSHAIEEASLYHDLGVDYLLVSAPSYNRPTEKGLYAHFKSIHDCCKTPIILYNHPGRTGVSITTELIKELSQLPRIVGVKQSCGSTAEIDRSIQETESDFSVLVGDDLLAYSSLALGAQGLISVCANIAPSMMKKLVHSSLNGNFKEALALHRKLSPLFIASSFETNPIPIKYALSETELSAGPCRLPLTPLNEVYRKKMRHITRELKL